MSHAPQSCNLLRILKIVRENPWLKSDTNRVSVLPASLRERKEVFLSLCYSVNMDASINAKSTVNELLATHPQTAAVFLALRTSCVGCHLARFCMLEDVARVYELPVHDLLDQLTSIWDKRSSRLLDTEQTEKNP